MDTITTVTTKGQVTIPIAIRQALKVEIGDKVSFTEVDPFAKQATIKVIPIDIVEEMSGSLSSKVKTNDYKRARRAAGKLLLEKYKIK